MKTCKYCKEKFTPIQNLQYLCLPPKECSWKYIALMRDKKIKKDNANWKKNEKEKVKKLSVYEAEARKVFQAWVRKRDELLPCISCGKTSDRYDGGHYFDAGVYSGLIFNEWNVNKQCSYFCNKMNHGNKPNYRIGLVKKIGLENVMWLEENKDRLRNYKYTKDELIEIKERYLLLMTK